MRSRPGLRRSFTGELLSKKCLSMIISVNGLAAEFELLFIPDCEMPLLCRPVPPIRDNKPLILFPVSLLFFNHLPRVNGREFS